MGSSRGTCTTAMQNCRWEGTEEVGNLGKSSIHLQKETGSCSSAIVASCHPLTHGHGRTKQAYLQLIMSRSRGEPAHRWTNQGHDSTILLKRAAPFGVRPNLGNLTMLHYLIGLLGVPTFEQALARDLGSSTR